MGGVAAGNMNIVLSWTLCVCKGLPPREKIRAFALRLLLGAVRCVEKGT